MNEINGLERKGRLIKGISNNRSTTEIKQMNRSKELEKVDRRFGDLSLNDDDDVRFHHVQIDRRIDDLPLDVLRMIFEHLDLENLVHCRSVCTKWLYAIDKHMKPCESLVIIGRDRIVNNYWYYDFDPISARCLVRSTNIDRFESFKNKFANLKRLKIDCRIGVDFNLGFLTEFDGLGHLELREVHLANDRQLRFNELKVLYIGIYSQNSSRLSVDAPRLTVLFTNNLSDFDLVTKNTVEYLETTSAGYFDIDAYTNLQTLNRLKQQPQHKSLNYPDLIKLNKHKELGKF